MVTLSDIKPIIPQIILDRMQCNGTPFDSGCEGETRKVEGRQCDPPTERSMPMERGGTMDRLDNLSIW